MAWEDVERKYENKEDSDRVPYTKFKEGVTLIRVLGDEPYSFWSHWMTKHNKGVTCLGKGCPICSVIASQKANNEKPTYGSSHRHAIKIWNYAEDKMEIMIQGRDFFQQLLNLHREVGDIKTYDIKVTRTGIGTDTTYMLLPTAPKDFAITDGITEVDVSEQLQPMDKEKLLMLMEGKSWEEVFGNAEQ